MKRGTLIILNVAGWTALIVYLVVSMRYTSARKDEVVCSRVNVKVLDSRERDFITSEMVTAWFSTGEMPVIGKEMSEINTREVEKFITRRGYVKKARVYTSIDGSLNIELTQRTPLMRFNTAGGYNFYLTDDGFVVPAQRHAVEYVPLITGDFEFPFAKGYIGYVEEALTAYEKKVSKSYEFLGNLINFVTFLRGNDFWNSLIVQVYVRRGVVENDYEPQVEIVPRVGNHVVELGGLDGYEQKLNALVSFYRRVPYDGWDKYRKISVKYRGQIVCSE